MIISCPECNKRFNINQNLIPEDGRLLQCSSCMHKWHFIIKKNDKIIEDPIISEQVITEDKNQENKINPSEVLTMSVETFSSPVNMQTLIQKHPDLFELVVGMSRAGNL